MTIILYLKKRPKYNDEYGIPPNGEDNFSNENTMPNDEYGIPPNGEDNFSNEEGRRRRRRKKKKSYMK